MVALSLIILSISWTTIFSGHMLIADESAGLSEGKETLVNQKQKHSGEEMSTTDIPDYNVIDGTGDKSNKSDQVTKKSPRKKQKISYKSIFTTDSSGYNFVSEEDEDGQIDLSVNKNTEIQEQKILDGTVFTSDSPNYNSIGKQEDTNEKYKKTSLVSVVKKLLPNISMYLLHIPTISYKLIYSSGCRRGGALIP